MSLIKRLQALLGRKESDPEPQNVEQLRLEFSVRYHWFRRLLQANRGALEAMATIQELLSSEQPFSMVRVRTLCARVSLEVWKIVDSMRRLAPEKHQALEDRLQEIKTQIESLLGPAEQDQTGPLILDMRRIGLQDANLVGQKLAMLAELSNKLGLLTPKGFAVTTVGFRKFMQENELGEEIERRIRATDPAQLDSWYALSSDLQTLILETAIPADLQQEIQTAAQDFLSPFAVRSSALSEDGKGTSFAGLHRSVLNVDAEELLQAVKEVLASLYSLPAMSYRFHMGIPDWDALMCVGVLEMLQARSGGVLYTRDPLGRSEYLLINSVWGLPKPIVDGSCRGDLFRISHFRLEIEVMEPEEKDCAYVPHAREGIARRQLGPGEGRALSISEEEALNLARQARKMEEHFGFPLDVEWVINPEGEIIILQARPLQFVHENRAEDALESVDSVDVLARGRSASPGVASGPVRLVQKGPDMLDFPQGAVLVTSTASPNLASLLGRAAAVVAERGSLTGHLATVCREYQVPALFGVPGAVDLLQDGQEITVNADLEVLQQGQQASDQPAPRPWLSTENPVRKTLRQAANFITPLHLTDPESPYFVAQNVRTYHDITRFCHEKAIEEMFSFGREHTFPERSSKQLVYNNSKTRWWVLNLDNGFKGEVPGTEIRLEDIACMPMLAIWEGVTAVPWQGPPPLNPGGFMSVLFRSTQDSSLVPGGRMRQHERNYFMISKEYCSLSSRLGYHFSIIEALVTARPMENYALFRFQGGAADDQRRNRRVQMICEILQEQGFDCLIRADSLRASIQGRSDQEILQALKVLGYLNIHTRQIDMALSSKAMANSYANQLRQGISKTLQANAPGQAPQV